MRTSKQERLKRIAYHEAGHAVLCYVLHRQFKEASIVPNEEAGTLGHVDCVPWSDQFQAECEASDRRRGALEKAVIIDFAGCVAEQRLAGRYNWRGASADFRNTMACLACLTRGQEESNAYAHWLFERTKGLVGDVFNWAAVEALAAELLNRECIGYRESRRIITEAMENGKARFIEKAKAGAL